MSDADCRQIGRDLGVLAIAGVIEKINFETVELHEDVIAGAAEFARLHLDRNPIKTPADDDTSGRPIPSEPLSLVAMDMGDLTEIAGRAINFPEDVTTDEIRVMAEYVVLANVGIADHVMGNA